MKSCTVATCVVVLATAAACACRGELASDRSASASERTVLGRVLLPDGIGSRGVEIVVTVATAGAEPRRTWVLFDQQGRFSHTFEGQLLDVSVSTGLRAELCRIEAAELGGSDESGRIDLGQIDVRDRLTTHRVVLRAADGAALGDVRVAMCFGPPPVGPRGGRVALGSRQFPPIALGSEMEWLVPRGAKSVHFLVERPAESAAGGPWRTGRQRLFGPFSADGLPRELVVD
ncbi:MAG: hypothetical protein KDB80_05435 [Planctomycetes bacterium]|nr:hypothetical protein [Planctomycetota bacterium]